MKKNKPRIVAVAYDLKAALDLAAALIRGGLDAEAFTGAHWRDDCGARAAVYDAESYFMPPEEEYALLTRLFSAAPRECLCFLKSDSSLRGNLGSELAALRDARHEDRLLLIPAFPKARRFTRGGIQYQLPEEGQEGEIPLGNAARLISAFRGSAVRCGPLSGFNAAEGCVYVADCASQTELDAIMEELAGRPWSALAGSGALAEGLGFICGLRPAGTPRPPEAPLKLDGKPGVLRLDTLEWKEAK